MRRRSSVLPIRLLIAIALTATLCNVSSNSRADVLLAEDWESGMGLWSASNGVWESGIPTVACTPHGGRALAGTNLAGTYPRYTDSRLESPSLSLPSNPVDGQIWLHFWQWFAFYRDGDLGRVEISVDHGPWQPIGNTMYHYSGGWSPYAVDLSAYAGMSVRVGLRFADAAPYGASESWGWYVDDLTIREGRLPWVSGEGFDGQYLFADAGGWYADRGVWQIGTPSWGIVSARTGRFCAATVLDANYPRYCDSRLVSPPIDISASPVGGVVSLSFMHLLRLYSDGDWARVEVFVDGAWQGLSTTMYHSSGPWTEAVLDLTPFVGKTIQVGFRIADAAPYGASESTGWFIDDVAVVEGPLHFDNPHDFEGGSRGWAATNGVWEIGVPTSGPGAARSGVHCWGTNLSGNYPRYTATELLSPWIDLPAAPTGSINLQFYEWHHFYTDGDYGVVRLHKPDGTVADLSAHFTAGGSGGWSQWTSADLGALYPGERVRFGWFMADAAPYGAQERTGWYVDDVRIAGMPQSSPESWPDFGADFPMVSRSTSGALVSWFYLPFDPEYVAVYASRDPWFVPNLGNRIALLTSDPTSYLDVDRHPWEFFYRVTLVDALGHESAPGPVHSPLTDAPPLGPARIASLDQNFPNPFNPTTTIRFELRRAARVGIEVFDLMGRRVRTVFAERGFERGIHTLPFEGNDLASGTYVLRLTVDGEHFSRKMVVTK